MPDSTQRTTSGALGIGGADLMAAADIIADAARVMAGRFSSSIPPSIHVEGNGRQVTIIADAPAAYPNEVFGVRHPLFGDREHWYTNQHRPFLGAAADQKAGPAMARYARKIDRMCRSAGFR